MTLGHCVVTQQLRPKERPGGVWRELRLGEVVELQRGYDLPRRQRVPGSIPLVPSSGVTDYHAWRADPQESPLPLGEGQGEGYTDVPGFRKSAALEEVRKHGHVRSRTQPSPIRLTLWTSPGLETPLGRSWCRRECLCPSRQMEPSSKSL